jgi:hypothetical protein
MFQYVPSIAPTARSPWFASVDTSKPLDSAPSRPGVKLNDSTWTASNSTDAAVRGGQLDPLWVAIQSIGVLIGSPSSIVGK